MTVNRPFLKYHGGKFRIAPWIIENFPQHKIYVEPFCGAAGVLLRKPKSSNEVLNDLNGRLISAFRVLRDPGLSEMLRESLKYTPCSAVEYNEAREPHLDPVEDARRLIILGHQGFGSTGASGGKLTGWRRGVRKDRQRSSGDEWSDIYKYIDEWSDRLRSVFLESMDATDLIKQWDSEETLFYVDPPYLPNTRHGPGNEGYAHELTEDQHIELSVTLKQVKGKVVLSGYPSELYNDLYSNWTRKEKQTMADKGKHATEILWLSPNAIETEGRLF